MERLREEREGTAAISSRQAKELLGDEELERRVEEKYKDQFESAQRIADLRAHIERVKNSLPKKWDFEWIHRAEKHISGNLYRAIRELERSRCRRVGANVSPPLVLEMHQD